MRQADVGQKKQYKIRKGSEALLGPLFPGL